MGETITERMAEESREVRFKMHRLVEGGMGERIALRNVLKNDGNRSRKLSTWRKRGLWPVPAEELAEHGQAVIEETEQTTSTLTAPTRPETPQLVEATRPLPEDLVISNESETETALEPTPPTVEVSQKKDPRTTQPTSGLLAPPSEDTEEVNAMMEQLLSLYRSGRLAELAESEAQETTTTTRPHMPRLKMKPSSTYLSVELMAMAEAKAQEDPTLPAGQTWNRSSIVNYLIWEYLGYPSAEEVEGQSGE